MSTQNLRGVQSSLSKNGTEKKVIGQSPDPHVTFVSQDSGETF